MSISWNEMQDRAAEFASKWEGETYKKGESQSFWSDFLAVYGIDRRRYGAFFNDADVFEHTTLFLRKIEQLYFNYEIIVCQ